MIQDLGFGVDGGNFSDWDVLLTHYGQYKDIPHPLEPYQKVNRTNQCDKLAQNNMFICWTLIRSDFKIRMCVVMY